MRTASYRLFAPDSRLLPWISRAAADHDLGEALSSFITSVESFVNCEMMHRKAERVSALGLPKAEHYEKAAIAFNSQGLRSLKASRALLAEATKAGLAPRKQTPERLMAEIVDECEVLLRNAILETDLAPEEAKAIWGSYGEARGTLEKGGFKGLVEYLGAKGDALMEARTDLKKGRAHGSPYSFWKAIVLAIILAIILLVLFCVIIVDPDYFRELVRTYKELIDKGC